MRLLRLLVWLLAALTLSAPSMLAAAGPMSVHAKMHCNEHDDGKSKATIGHGCCTPTVAAVPIAIVDFLSRTDSLDRSVRPAFRLHGITMERDPPPPRV
jgi:hypothetical protein